MNKHFIEIVKYADKNGENAAGLVKDFCNDKNSYPDQNTIDRIVVQARAIIAKES